jgi:hypothetical protein
VEIAISSLVWHGDIHKYNHSVSKQFVIIYQSTTGMEKIQKKENPRDKSTISLHGFHFSAGWSFKTLYVVIISLLPSII